MSFIIVGSDGREYGPADAELVKNWIGRNLANLQTKARLAEVEPPEWKTLGDFPEFASIAPPPALPPVSVPENLQEPVPVVVEACIEEALRTARTIHIFDCIGRGWALLKTDYWPMFGAMMVSMLCATAVAMIPSIGTIFQMLLTGIFTGGLFYYFIGRARGEPRRLADVFSGFRRMTKDLILGCIVPGLLAFLAMLPGFIIGGASVAIAAALTAPDASFEVVMKSLPPAAFIGIGAGMLFVVCVAEYFSIAWMFVLSLIIDRRIKFWAAMTISRRVVSRQWWRVFGLSLVVGCLVFAGCLLCIVGALFVLPVFYATMAYAYDDLFSGMQTGKSHSSAIRASWDVQA
ncbi:MAG: hypothetical protein LBV54_05125 [Puniceicoccales bacterium]|jgi:uncharacterized membrane protein|nr:hypothetical protein [Puniceicoccales bacterium]